MIPKFRGVDKKTKQLREVKLLDYYHDVVWLDDIEDTGISITAHRKVDDVVLMQSTGLFDSQPEPVELYKDDIVKRTALAPGGRDFVGVVKFLEGSWVLDNGNEAIPLWTEVDEIIVLGNIHENPELVEGGIQ